MKVDLGLCFPGKSAKSTRAQNGGAGRPRFPKKFGLAKLAKTNSQVDRVTEGYTTR
jgi:hypothetical protein